VVSGYAIEQNIPLWLYSQFLYKRCHVVLVLFGSACVVYVSEMQDDVHSASDYHVL
jgi:hypothetical protein